MKVLDRIGNLQDENNEYSNTFDPVQPQQELEQE